ncbi:MAG: hypothetical protein ACO1OX_05680 [Novosphingobium sp.]
MARYMDQELAVSLKRAVLCNQGSDLALAPPHRHENHAHGKCGCGGEDE